MLSEKVSYLKGLMEGLDIDSSTKEGKVLKLMADILEEMAGIIEDISDEVDEVVELVDIIDRDLGDVEEDIYDFDEEYDDDIDNDDDIDDDDDYSNDVQGAYSDVEYDDEDEIDDKEQMYECNCTNCGDTIYISESIVKEGSMRCPNCNTLLEFNYLEDDDEDNQ